MKTFTFTPEGTIDCSVRARIHGMDETGIISENMHPAVLICPGGGYDHISERESDPVADVFYAAGYNTFILKYSVEENARNLQPLCQLAGAMAQIRKNKEEWHTLPDKIAVCGFSAGGHLAASLGTLYQDEKFLRVFGRQDHIRPDAMILCYPVITSDEHAHERSLRKVSGDEKGGSEYQWFGLDRHVTSQTPPTFLWHTATDGTVPVENSLKMASALSAAHVSLELHIFPEGKHGMSVCTSEVGTESKYNARWVEWCITWLNQVFGVNTCSGGFYSEI